MLQKIDIEKLRSYKISDSVTNVHIWFQCVFYRQFHALVFAVIKYF